MRLSRAIAIAACALLVGSCSSLNSPSKLILLSVEADRYTIVTGETATITITARNAGDHAETMTGRSDCLVYFEVFANDATQVYDARAACTGSQVTQTLDVDASISRTFTWDGGDLAGGRQSGTYALRPSIALASGAYRGLTVTMRVE